MTMHTRYWQRQVIMLILGAVVMVLYLSPSWIVWAWEKWGWTW